MIRIRYVVSCDEAILLIPNCSDQILQIKNNNVLLYGNMPDGFMDLVDGFREYWKRFYSTNIIDNKIIELCPGRSNMLLRINLIDSSISGECYQMSDDWMTNSYKKDYLIEYIKECNFQGDVITEWDGMKLEDFVEILQQ